VTASPPDVVFLLDVDNTLLDNDAIVEELRRRLVDVAGPAGERRYWEIFEELWNLTGHADYLGAFERFGAENPESPTLGASFLLEYPFASRLYPRALDVVARLRERGPVVILSDGDAVFQPLKVERSGLRAAVDGHVLIYVHKEQMLDDVGRRYPARRYVMVDDKVRILAAMKAAWGDRLTTVFVRQGHYAREAGLMGAPPPGDIVIETIGDLLDRADTL